MGRRAIKFLGSALGRDCSCSTTVLHCYIFANMSTDNTNTRTGTGKPQLPILGQEEENEVAERFEVMLCGGEMREMRIVSDISLRTGCSI
uniref:Uncharacterized protein n=1 Tax=Oryza sativa subsp. japonica TaxID=39947 RepID=Q6H8B2_ORYSJ|nr:hypothetical protein [Oryza sativa Japonica Group]